MSVKKIKLLSIIFCIAMAISTVIAVIPGTASAKTDKTLTLICRKDDVTLSGMQWRLYKVGERQNNEFVLTGEFADYQVDLNDMSADNISSAAKTLEAYAAADQIPTIAAGKTDENGELRFDDLETGLYLAAGKVLQVGNVYYVPSALLIDVDEEGGSLDYNAYPKFYYAVIDSNLKSYAVKKVWIGDEGNTQERPVSVTVDIYKDDILEDTVVLDESNDWQYGWIDPEASSKWYVVERNIPENYRVSIENNMTQYLIKNSYVTTTVTTTATESNYSEKTSSTTKAAETKLPQTGQLWWPVPLLGAGGLLSIGIGLRLGKKDDE